jgi:isoquinoline 1-oxidoreductase beta subunit
MTDKIAAIPKVGLSRRDFLASTVAVGGAMVLGFYLPSTSAQAAAVQGQPWYHDAMVPEINAWLTIAPDDTVTIRVAQTEMGTGIFTSCPNDGGRGAAVRLEQGAGRIRLAAT